MSGKLAASNKTVIALCMPCWSSRAGRLAADELAVKVHAQGQDKGSHKQASFHYKSVQLDDICDHICPFLFLAKEEHCVLACRQVGRI